MKPSTITLLLLVASTGAQAFEQSDHRMESARAQTFAEFKAIESASHRQRIQILQEADACIKAAQNREQYQVCEERERETREHSNAAAKSSRQALREKLDGSRQAMLSDRR
jgi:hypothetical protein